MSVGGGVEKILMFCQPSVWPGPQWLLALSQLCSLSLTVNVVFHHHHTTPHHTTVATLDHSATTERSRHNTSGRSFNFILTLHIKTTLELHQPVFSITYNNINTSLWLSFSTHWCRKPIFHRGQVVVSICWKIHIYLILPSFFHLKRLKVY